MLAYRLIDVRCSLLNNRKKMPFKMESMTNSVESLVDESAHFEIQRLKSRIVNQITHEFRTPLTSIIGFAEMLGEDIQIDENQRIEYASYIRNEGLRLTKLVDDLIRLDSLEQGQFNIQFDENEIQGTVRYAIKLVAESALNKFIRISIEMPDEPLLFKFDREKIIQALYQLLHNAVRFTKPGGLMSLKVESTDNHVAISIHDNGPGILARDIPFLFRRFGKLYRPVEETHGSGVGLAIVKHIVDQHKGDIAVQSQVGEGSTFIVRIPILA
jgi:two-component system, OmpR family, sensor histidine kinase ResE